MNKQINMFEVRFDWDQHRFLCLNRDVSSNIWILFSHVKNPFIKEITVVVGNKQVLTEVQSLNNLLGMKTFVENMMPFNQKNTSNKSKQI